MFIFDVKLNIKIMRKKFVLNQETIARLGHNDDVLIRSGQQTWDIDCP